MTDESEFIRKIDARFPYTDLERGFELAREACGISANAAFAVLHELARPPRGARADASNRLAVSREIASLLNHPLATIVLELTRKLILGSQASVTEAIEVMRAVSLHPGQYAALSIAYFSCDDVNGKADREYEQIRTDWELL